MIDLVVKIKECDLEQQVVLPQYYSHHARELKQTQKYKISKFLEHKCIEYAGDGMFICKPIKGYNKRTYELIKNKEGEFECNCQYYVLGRRIGESRFCSHLGVLYEYLKRGRKYD